MPQNLLTIVVDRWHAGMVGAYGNSWIRTRWLDRLATESFVFDAAFVNDPRLERLYDGFWRLRSAGESAGASFDLPRLLGGAGFRTALVTDEAEVKRLAAGRGFDEIVFVEPQPTAALADAIDDTELARLFAAVARWLETAAEPFSLWVHARGMAGAWDAPYALREQYADEDDPRPPDFVKPPDYAVPDDADPDHVLGVMHAYAGQVALLDACLETFFKSPAMQSCAARTATMLLGARGYPLGEHGRIGPGDERLYNELTQVPWFVRLPDGRGRMGRSQTLVQSSDLPVTLLELAGAECPGSAGGATSVLPLVDGAEVARPCAFLRSATDRALRTRAWLLRQPNDGAAELYAKPGDRWEVNDVARRCGEEVEEMQAVLARIESGAMPRDFVLPEKLVTIAD